MKTVVFENYKNHNIERKKTNTRVYNQIQY